MNEYLHEEQFRIDDLQIFGEAFLRNILTNGAFGLTVQDLAWSVQDKPDLIARIDRALSDEQRSGFWFALRRPVSPNQIKAARRRVLQRLFWPLTYWKTPGLYDELTAGERLHPGIFDRLEPDLQGGIILDAGAGSGRASLECLARGARVVYAVDPCPGLLRLLQHKRMTCEAAGRIIPCQGCFNELPLRDASVDLALSCSAFTARPEQGGEVGLAEMQRVTRPGGKIVIIWPRPKDHEWFTAHGFQYVSLPMAEAMTVHFESLQTAMRCARRFYRRSPVVRYLLKRQQPEVPFSLLGMSPPCDYFVLQVGCDQTLKVEA